eukprot:681254-Rhodomonas_salina.3
MSSAESQPQGKPQTQCIRALPKAIREAQEEHADQQNSIEDPASKAAACWFCSGKTSAHALHPGSGCIAEVALPAAMHGLCRCRRACEQRVPGYCGVLTAPSVRACLPHEVLLQSTFTSSSIRVPPSRPNSLPRVRAAPPSMPTQSPSQPPASLDPLPHA